MSEVICEVSGREDKTKDFSESLLQTGFFQSVLFVAALGTYHEMNKLFTSGE